MRYLIVVFSFVFIFLGTAFGVREEFDQKEWEKVLAQTKKEAVEMGISKRVINDVFSKPVFLPKVVSRDRNQAEFTMPFEKYISRTVSASRIKDGREALKKNYALLDKVEKEYGIPKQYLAAFWGVESHYGNFNPSNHLTDSFLTLIYDGRRETFFKKQLFSLMRMADKNSLDLKKVKGSWAGAMGHFQFIPTTLEDNEIDGDGDGKVNIIESFPDAVFSAGNFLKKLGWHYKEKAVREVKLPANFNVSLADVKTKRSLSKWASLGVKDLDGKPLPREKMSAGLIIVGEENKRAFLLYNNFYSAKKWNHSNYYALSVALLAEEIVKQ